MKIEICFNTSVVLVVVGIVASMSAAMVVGAKYKHDAEARIAEAQAVIEIVKSCEVMKQQALTAKAKEPECINVKR